MIEISQAFAEVFREVVCRLSIALLLGLTAVAAVAWLTRTIATPMRRLLRGSVARIALAAAMVGTGIVESFSKHTNDPPRSVPPPNMVGRVIPNAPLCGGRGATALPPVTPDDISNGWRVAAIREGRALSRPDGGACTIHEPWLVRGGFEDVVRLSPVGWIFPWRDGFADKLTVFSDGEIRLNLRTSHFPRPFEASLAVVPAFNWPQLPGSVSNVFWHAATPSNSLIVAWENAPVNRDANSLTNFQAEFFADGRFIYRYEDCTVDYAPVPPFDLDGDGLENSVDPDPLVAGADAHGTNAEWYNVVCSNVFEVIDGGTGTTGILPVGDGYLSWREGVNTNAYYFVDVVAERGPAPIYFTGDRESRLGNPVVVARGGETNHVPLLMGVEYSVTSTVPITVSSQANVDVAVAGDIDGRAFSVRWPLSFGFGVAPGGGYEVEVQPFDPGGEFSWSAANGGLNLRSGSGCSYSSVGNWVGFACGGGNCGCDGCSIDGIYCIEGASFALPSLWCGCNTFWHGDTNEPPSEPSVSVSFDKAAVFYEDAYTNAPGDVVAKRSSNTTLTVSAYGGEEGGVLYISASNIGRLVRTGGNAITFPYSTFVPPLVGMSFSIEYEAETHSDFMDDVSVSASIMPAAGQPNTATAFASAVKVKLTAIAIGVENPSRHVYGVRESVLCESWPQLPSSSWVASGSGYFNEAGTARYFICPILAAENCLKISYDGTEYRPEISVVEPTGVVVESPQTMDFHFPKGIAGGSGLSLPLHITPLNVSFTGIAVEEVPTETGEHTGYFGDVSWQEAWYHTTARGAGNWINIQPGNFFMEDEACMADICNPPWQHGKIIWNIPIGWGERNSSESETPVKIIDTIYHQIFEITSEGTLNVTKFGYTVSRSTNDVIVLIEGE